MIKSRYYIEKMADVKNRLVSIAIVVSLVLLSLVGIYKGIEWTYNGLSGLEEAGIVMEALSSRGYSCKGVTPTGETSSSGLPGCQVHYYKVDKFYAPGSKTPIRGVTVGIARSEYDRYKAYFTECIGFDLPE